jgi:hypothetical protein
LHLWQNSIGILTTFVIKTFHHATCHLNPVDTEYIMPLTLLALTIGAVAIGTTDFVTAGLVPLC